MAALEFGPAFVADHIVPFLRGSPITMALMRSEWLVSLIQIIVLTTSTFQPTPTPPLFNSSMIPLQSQRFAQPDQELESDSDSEEEQTLQQQDMIPRKRRTRSQCGCLKGVLLGVVLSVAVGALMGFVALPADNKNSSPQPQPAQTKLTEVSQQPPNIPLPVSVSNNKPSLPIADPPKPQPKPIDKPQPIQAIQKPPIQPITPTVQPPIPTAIPQGQLPIKKANFTSTYGEITFILDGIKQGTTYWTVNHTIECQPDEIINSAFTIEKDQLYVQKTAYKDISVVLPRVTIPAMSIYRLEGPRQLIKKILSAAPDTVVAYEHYDPQLLILTAIMTGKGFYLTENPNKELFQQNLVINDLFPWANFVQTSKLYDSKAYQLLITNNPEAIDLLSQRPDLALVIELTQPVEIPSTRLLKMAVYKIQEGTECDERSFPRTESPSWRLDEVSWLVPGWYALLPAGKELTQVHKQMDYENVASTRVQRHCFNDQEEQPEIKPFHSFNKYVLEPLPCEMLTLFRMEQDDQFEESKARQIMQILEANDGAKSILFHSGPYQHALIISALLPPQIQLTVPTSYPHRQILIKNLILNDLQTAITEKQSTSYDIVFTANKESLGSITATQIVDFSS